MDQGSEVQVGAGVGMSLGLGRDAGINAEILEEVVR